jgi:hypothetical protein
MPEMLVVSAFEFGDPLAHLVLVITGDRSLHAHNVLSHDRRCPCQSAGCPTPSTLAIGPTSSDGTTGLWWLGVAEVGLGLTRRKVSTRSGVALRFEELLACGKEIELGEESEEAGRVGSVDGYHANAVVGHPVGHRT